mmetsp:Transcript_21177/g.50021  ORF Transcript_21177/g.50021 Transcript_21177/m.50021 type:complete len:209 (+) Transcript_21177:3095-3721(+)
MDTVFVRLSKGDNILSITKTVCDCCLSINAMRCDAIRCDAMQPSPSLQNEALNRFLSGTTTVSAGFPVECEARVVHRHRYLPVPWPLQRAGGATAPLQIDGGANPVAAADPRSHPSGTRTPLRGAAGAWNSRGRPDDRRLLRFLSWPMPAGWKQPPTRNRGRWRSSGGTDLDTPHGPPVGDRPQRVPAWEPSQSHCRLAPHRVPPTLK